MPEAAISRPAGIDFAAVALRPAVESDEPFLFTLYASTRRQEVEAWGWPEPQVQAFLTMQFRAQRLSYAAAYSEAEHHIVCCGQDPVGRLMVAAIDRHLHLVDISLLPQTRGHGLGTMLIRGLFDRCRAQNVSLTLQVAVANIRARSLYERLGFQRFAGDAMYEQMRWNP